MPRNSKTRRSLCATSLALLLCAYSNAQSITGKVTDYDGNPLWAVNLTSPNGGHNLAISDIDGTFSFDRRKLANDDTILFSCIGYHSEALSLDALGSGHLAIRLREKTTALGEVVVRDAPIAKEFSVKELKSLDIYMNPAASADPLKAVSLLPYATNTSENASPEIRGSDGSRTLVYVNEVPVYRPVRNTQLNGIGHFSLLNADLLSNLTVYAANPPLKYGNTTAGLVDVQTLKRADDKWRLKLSMSLANFGGIYSQQIKDDAESFIVAYGNTQLSGAYLGINCASFSHVEDFRTYDVGVNWRQQLSKHLSVSIFSYANTERYSAQDALFNYLGDVSSSARRNFNIANINLNFLGLYSTINYGHNISETYFSFGNYSIAQKDLQHYASLNVKSSIGSLVTIQGGTSHDHSVSQFDNRNPVTFYAIRQDDAMYAFSTKPTANITEAYLYAKLNVRNFIVGAGVRKNIAYRGQANYLSFQANARWDVGKGRHITISAGRYNGYSLPNYLVTRFTRIVSKQAELAYYSNHNHVSWSTSLYCRCDSQSRYFQDIGEARDTRIDTYGAEFSVECSVRAFQLSASYSFLHSDIDRGTGWHTAENSMKYMVKSQLNYYNNDLLNASINFVARPGLRYTPVATSSFDNSVGTFRPAYGSFLSARYGSYASVDFAVNKIVPIRRTRCTFYAMCTNALGRKNQEKIVYNEDYASHSFWTFQGRVFYFGVTIDVSK